MSTGRRRSRIPLAVAMGTGLALATGAAALAATKRSAGKHRSLVDDRAADITAFDLDALGVIHHQIPSHDGGELHVVEKGDARPPAARAPPRHHAPGADLGLPAARPLRPLPGDRARPARSRAESGRHRRLRAPPPRPRPPDRPRALRPPRRCGDGPLDGRHDADALLRRPPRRPRRARRRLRLPRHRARRAVPRRPAAGAPASAAAAAGARRPAGLGPAAGPSERADRRRVRVRRAASSATSRRRCTSSSPANASPT